MHIKHKGRLKKSEGKELSLYKRERLVDNVLIIEGITRAGKFLMGNILDGFEGVEHYQYLGLLEHMPFLERLKFISSEAAKAIIQCQIDNNAYDLMVGRNINFRFDDKSSIYNSPRLKEYIERTLKEDGDVVVNSIKQQNSYFPYILHEAFPNIILFFDIYPDCKIVRVDRSPIDLVYSWYQRGWGRRYGKDPKDFSMPIRGINGPAPWFAYQWLDEYKIINEMDRIIKLIISVVDMSRETYLGLTNNQKKRVHILTFENLVTKPDEEIKRLSIFINKNPLPDMGTIKARAKIPDVHPREIRDQKIGIIKQKATPEYFAKLLQVEKEYETTGTLLIGNNKYKVV